MNVKWKLAYQPRAISTSEVRRAIKASIDVLGTSFAIYDPKQPRATRVVRDDKWIREIAALQRALELLPKS